MFCDICDWGLISFPAGRPSLPLPPSAAVNDIALDIDPLPPSDGIGRISKVQMTSVGWDERRVAEDEVGAMKDDQRKWECRGEASMDKESEHSCVWCSK
jgi:hypothetical protein